MEAWDRLAECLQDTGRETGETAGDVRYVLFDYSHKDPVKGHASVRFLSFTEERQDWL